MHDALTVALFVCNILAIGADVQTRHRPAKKAVLPYLIVCLAIMLLVSVASTPLTVTVIGTAQR